MLVVVLAVSLGAEGLLRNLEEGEQCFKKGMLVGGCAPGLSCVGGKVDRFCIRPKVGEKAKEVAPTPLKEGETCAFRGEIYGTCEPPAQCIRTDEAKGRVCKVPCPDQCNPGQHCVFGKCTDIVLKLGEVCRRRGISNGVCPEGSECRPALGQQGKICQLPDLCRGVVCDAVASCDPKTGDCVQTVLKEGEVCKKYGKPLGVCADGLECRYSGRGGRICLKVAPGQGTPKVKRGEPCMDGREVMECEQGLVCDAVQDKCVAAVKEGGACDSSACMPGLACFRGRCKKMEDIKLEEKERRKAGSRTTVGDVAALECITSENGVVPDGVSYKKACNICTCTKGLISCTEQTCLFPFDTQVNMPLGTFIEIVLALVILLVLAYVTGLIKRKRRFQKLEPYGRAVI